MMSRLADRALNVISILTGGAIVALMLLTVVDVFKRQFLSSGVRGVIEITEVALVAVVFLGMVGAEAAKRHVRTPVVVNMLPLRPAAVLRLIGLVLSVVLTAWIAYVTADIAIDSVQNRESRFGLLEVPVWPARLLIPIGMGGFCLVLTARAVNLTRNLITGQLVKEKSHFEDVL